MRQARGAAAIASIKRVFSSESFMRIRGRLRINNAWAARENMPVILPKRRERLLIQLSLFLIWVISWERIPAISWVERREASPWVKPMADADLSPKAKALGCLEGR